MLKTEFINVLTKESKQGYYFGRIDEEYLKMEVLDAKRNFYVCGPDEFVKSINLILERMGASTDLIVFEK
jgi:ferredoxin-NADP reductase